MIVIEGRFMRRALLLGLVGGLLLPASGSPQIFPHRVDVAKYTCRELLALSGEARDRALIYFNGYLDGKTGASVWADEVVGARIERVVNDCKAAPTLPLLEAFDRAWKP